MTRIPPTVDWSAEVPDADVAAAESGEADPVDVAEQQEAGGNEDDDYSRDE